MGNHCKVSIILEFVQDVCDRVQTLFQLFIEIFSDGVIGCLGFIGHFDDKVVVQPQKIRLIVYIVIFHFCRFVFLESDFVFFLIFQEGFRSTRCIQILGVRIGSLFDGLSG